jgi:hypothetical protein
VEACGKKLPFIVGKSVVRRPLSGCPVTSVHGIVPDELAALSRADRLADAASSPLAWLHPAKAARSAVPSPVAVTTIRFEPMASS